MEIVYVYTKKRAEFGRQPLLSDSAAQLHINIEPDESSRDDFIEKDPVDMAVQYAPEMTEHEVSQCVKFTPPIAILHLVVTQ